MQRRRFVTGALLGVGGLAFRSPAWPAAADDDDTDEVPVPAPKGAVALFDGKDLSAWTSSRRQAPEPAWKVENGYVEVAPRTGNLVTKEQFHDFQLHLEFWVPYMPGARGQSRGNSGIYLQGKYEIQILDSYGLAPRNNDCGALYTVAAPLRNACKKPEKWQSYDIAFRAPRFKESGEMSEKGCLTVYQNRVLIQNNLEFADMTGHARDNPANDPHQPGPIVLQDHGNRVRFRNIWIIPY
jgi:hypothetical protein